MKVPAVLKSNKGIAVALVGVLFLGFLAGMEYKAYQVRSVLNETFEDWGEDFGAEESYVEPEEEVHIAKGLGDSIELATIEFTVNSAEEKDVIVDVLGSTRFPSDGAKFVVLNMTITNTLKEETSSDLDYFEVTDDQGRVYTYDWEVTTAVSERMPSTLQAGIPETGYVVFQLPIDAASYFMSIGKAGTSEVYDVVLK